MRALFLVPGLSRSGGIDVVTDHARRLKADHGWSVALVSVADPGALATAQAERWDVALATWWTTIPFLGELDAQRRGVLAQGMDPWYYRGAEFIDRTAAAAAVAAPFDVIAVSEWVAEATRAARPDARCHVVAPGIDKDVFGGTPRVTGEGPLRVLVEGPPAVWFKGVADAVAATRGMARPAVVTVAALDPRGAQRLGADHVVDGLDPAGMAALYSETDVVLKLSRFEGLGLAPIEAFHLGVPCVVTPYGGHASYLEDGVNGVLVGFDDRPGTVRTLNRLDEDRALLARLSEGALATAARWPGRPTSTAALVEAMTALGPGDADLGPVHAVRAQVASARGEIERLEARVAKIERDKADLEDHLADAQEEAHRYATRLEEARASRAYRIALAMRLLKPGRRG